jgi:hypothetical protein
MGMHHMHHMQHLHHGRAPVRPSPLGSTSSGSTPRRGSEVIPNMLRRGRTLGRIQQLRINADAVVKRRNGGVLARGYVSVDDSISKEGC